MISSAGIRKHVFGCLFLWILYSPLQTVLAAEPSSVRQSELINLLKNDCGACHGLTLQGGMGPALLPENLTGKTDEFLVTTILNGRKGTAMPPWQPFMNQDEALWLVGVLRRTSYKNK